MESLTLEANKNDISSYSNFDKVLQKHFIIDGSFDLYKKTFDASLTITFDIIDKAAKHIVLDAKSLKINTVECIETKQNLNFFIYDKNEDKEALGTPLVIDLPSEYKENKLTVKIGFVADEKAAAIKFLDKAQTKNKKYPFMFTQCEAILCRSLLPCQDSPSAKVSCEVKVKIDAPLTVLFSGLETKHYTEDKYNVFEYEQKIPIPTYLIAFAAGELEYGKLSERCGVWTEVGLKDQAVYEFESCETYLKKAEEYLTPYRWGVYNLLVLPFAFPYGGMENPCLTFVTPALLAGDRSMANVIAHEISHSWTGNLVTNKDWANFWVNEGFTTFMERKLSELVYGEDMANLEAQVGVGEMMADIEIMGNDTTFTSLAPDYSHCDPDDGFSTVPYEKGFTFLYYLETLVGKLNFQHIMQKYVTEFALKSVDYHAFKGVFEAMVKDIYKEKANEEVLSKIDWEKWITSRGKPIKSFEFKTKYIKEGQDLAKAFLEGKRESSYYETFKNWHTNVKLVFLNYLMENVKKIDDKVYANLRDVLKMHGNYNAEVKYIWYQIALITKHDDCIPYVKEFLLTHGRMKYIRPVYFEWYRYQKEEANKFFNENKMIYHQVAMRIVDDKFKLWNSTGKTE